MGSVKKGWKISRVLLLKVFLIGGILTELCLCMQQISDNQYSKNISVSLYIYEDCGTWRAGEAQTGQDVSDSKQLVMVDPIEGSGKKQALHNLRQAAPN